MAFLITAVDRSLVVEGIDSLHARILFINNQEIVSHQIGKDLRGDDLRVDVRRFSPPVPDGEVLIGVINAGEAF